MSVYLQRKDDNAGVVVVFVVVVEDNNDDVGRRCLAIGFFGSLFIRPVARSIRRPTTSLGW